MDNPKAHATYTASSPAKLNLTLAVLGKRPDGFHELDSLVIGVDFCDDVVVTPGAATADIACTGASIPSDENLSLQAATVLAAHLGRPCDVRIQLAKRIPIGGGMGGGSGNAAATLCLCNRAWDAGLTREQLAELGSQIGSDVPLFFALPGAVMRGRGEIVEPVSLAWSGWALLLMMRLPVSTAAVYGRFRPGAGERPNVGVAGMDRADDIMAACHNMLEPAVFALEPRVAALHRRIVEAGLGPVRVTGAGSTMFRLFDREPDARAAQREIEHIQPGLHTAVVKAPTDLGPIVARI